MSLMSYVETNSWNRSTLLENMTRQKTANRSLMSIRSVSVKDFTGGRNKGCSIDEEKQRLSPISWLLHVNLLVQNRSAPLLLTSRMLMFDWEFGDNKGHTKWCSAILETFVPGRDEYKIHHQKPSGFPSSSSDIQLLLTLSDFPFTPTLRFPSDLPHQHVLG